MAGMREQYLSIFERYWPQVEAGYNDTTGQLVGGWSYERGDEEFNTLNQNFLYPISLLAVAPETDESRRKPLEQMAIKVGDWIQKAQERDGSHEMITAEKSWGHLISPWIIHNWMESAYLIEPALDPKRMTLWHQGVRVGVKGLVEQLKLSEKRRKRPSVANLHAWSAATVFRAGQLYEIDEWCKAALPAIKTIVQDQQEGGYWVENTGPTTLYNHVTLHAMALCREYTGDKTITKCLERGTSFHLHSTYPDGTWVETLDDRVHYQPRVCPVGHLAFTTTPQGRRYARWLTERMLEEDVTKSFNYHGLSFLADSFRYATDQPESPMPLDRDKVTWRLTGADTAIRKRSPWFGAYSAIAGKSKEEQRFHLDRTGHLSIWHEKTGLITGDGNSKDQPSYAAFEWSDGDTSRFIAKSGSVDLDTKGDRVILDFGDGFEAQIRFTIKDNESATLTVTARSPKGKGGPGPALYHLPLIVEPGIAWQSASSDGQFDEYPVRLDGTALGGKLGCGGWSIDGIPDCASFAWPVLPHNPYREDGRTPQVSAVGMLTIPMTVRTRLNLTIT